MCNAEDTVFELTLLHSEQDDADTIELLRHVTVYADGERCTDFEIKITEDGETASVMLTPIQLSSFTASAFKYGTGRTRVVNYA